MIFRKSKESVTLFLQTPVNFAYDPFNFGTFSSSQNEKLNILAKVHLLLIFPKPFTQFFIPFPKCD